MWALAGLRTLGRAAPTVRDVSINGRVVKIEWSAAAARALAARSSPLVLELELYFSCLVKKFVHLHDEVPARATVSVTDKLQLCFRAVTSTACTMDVAERLGRQPEVEIETGTVQKLAPKRVRLDHAGGHWQAEFWM